MPDPIRLPLLSLLVVLTAALALPAQAQQGQRGGARAEARADAQPQQARQSRAVRGQDSMSDSIRHVRSANRGQVLSAERMHSDGREINRIKMVDDRGRVRVYEDDPQQRRQRSRGRDD